MILGAGGKLHFQSGIVAICFKHLRESGIHAGDYLGRECGASFRLIKRTEKYQQHT